MFRAFFRRLPLLASLIVLVSVSLISGAPAAHAASQVSPRCPNVYQGYQHCDVALDATAPLLNASQGIDNAGVASTIQIFNPIVGQNDQESVAQETAKLCWPSLSCGSLIIYTAVLEFGWVVAPKTYGDSATHLFVQVRSSVTGVNCTVWWYPEGWRCHNDPFTSVWNASPPNGTSDYPGKTLTAGTSGNFFIAFCGGCGNSWWFNYNGNWIGNVSASTLGTDGSGNPYFTSVGIANWQGEVALSASVNSPTTWMGNGTCGTNASKSAHISNMQLFENGHPSYNAAELFPVFTQTYSKWYAGIPPSSTNNTLSYGGPQRC